MSEYEQFIRTEAKKRGIDPDIAVTVAKMEGGIDSPGLIGRFDTGWSFWQFQLHYAMAGQPGVTNPTVGMGEEFSRVTGWAPGDPAAWRDAARYALDHVKHYGWSAWYGAAKAGIVGMRGIDVNYPWTATPDDEWDYKKRGTQMPSIGYNPDAPIDAQPDPWSCSIQAVQFLLRTIGRNPDASDPKGDPWLRSQLVPALVTPELGLLDGSGRALADWVTREYGQEMNFVAQASPVTFDDVWAGAGVNPTIAGGAAFNHWIGIRRRNEDGTLSVANPGPGWKGVVTSISREQWYALGPWSAVWIDRASTLPAPPPPDPRAELRAKVRAILDRALAEVDAVLAG